MYLFLELFATCRTEKREKQREAKAEVAAQLEKSIERELLERLQKGVYPTDIININMKEFTALPQSGRCVPCLSHASNKLLCQIWHYANSAPTTSSCWTKTGFHQAWQLELKLVAFPLQLMLKATPDR